MPLKNERWEHFAKNVAKGMNNGAAYIAAVPVNKTHSGDMNAAKVSGHRLRRKDVVQARIGWLVANERRRQRAIENASQAVPDTFTRDDILRLFVEVSDTLQEAYVTAQNSSVPPIRLQQLRSVYADHTARLAKLTEYEDIPDNDHGQSNELIRRLNEIEVCTCQQT
ncbi:MAG: hypothetical protein ACRBB0_01400 [Pelagimonas sp.]|uniref:hypothetical protein n=1 Tax=Pelagimonas sp. TaxID=2073170 RepID=UPI003D6A8426